MLVGHFPEMILKINGKIFLCTEIPFVGDWNLTRKSIFDFSKMGVLKPVKNVTLLGEKTYLLLVVYIIRCEKYTFLKETNTF